MIRRIYEFFCLHRKNLLYTLVRRNLKVKYRGSVLGFLWTLLLPLAQVVVLYFVYRFILKVTIPNYLSFIVAGILPWIFFSATITECLETLVGGQSLLNQVSIPVQAFPASSVATNFVNFLLSLPALIIVMAISKIEVTGIALLFPLFILALFIFTYSLALIFACLYVYFRDLKHLFAIVVQLWFYLTPVVYSLEMVPEEFRGWVRMNPLTGFFAGSREVLLYGRPPDMDSFGIFLLWTFIALIAANIIYLLVGPKLVEKL